MRNTLPTTQFHDSALWHVISLDAVITEHFYFSILRYLIYL